MSKLMICPKATRDGGCIDFPGTVNACSKCQLHPHNRLCDEADEQCPACIPYVEPEQPTPTMPLREQFEEVIDKIISWELDRNVDDAITQRKVMLERIYSIIPAHDSAIASKAVKEFAKKAEKEISKKKTYGGNEQSTTFNRGLRVASEIVKTMAMGRE